MKTAIMKDSIKLHVTGKSGFGKSYYVKNELIPTLARYKPVIIFDRKGEYGGAGATDTPEKWKYYNSVIDFYGKTEKAGGVITCEPHVIKCTTDNDYNQGLRFFYALSQPVTLVLEEAHDLLKSSDFTETKKILIQIARHGRHEGIGIVLISQRVLDIEPDIRSQLTAHISFQQAYEGDRKALIQQGHTEAEKLVDLDKRKYLAFGEFPKHLKSLTKV